MPGATMLGPDNAVWDDGEWIGWDEINLSLAEQELRAKYPRADVTLIPYLDDLLKLAERYFRDTGRHLQVYGDIGELFGAVMYGIKLHSNYATGSDGRLGNNFVEVKTITPFKACDEVNVRLDRHFNKLLIVKVDENFQVSGRLLDRKELPAAKGKRLRVTWKMLDGGSIPKSWQAPSPMPPTAPRRDRRRQRRVHRQAVLP
jgi:hypothetical protein